MKFKGIEINIGDYFEHIDPLGYDSVKLCRVEGFYINSDDFMELSYIRHIPNSKCWTTITSSCAERSTHIIRKLTDIDLMCLKLEGILIINEKDKS